LLRSADRRRPGGAGARRPAGRRRRTGAAAGRVRADRADVRCRGRRDAARPGRWVMSADLLDALPPHKRELARLLLAARTAPAEHPRPRTGAGDVAAMPVQVRLLRAADPAAATGAHAVSLRGPLNRGALTRALAAVLDRHDALRTVLADHPAGPVLRERAPTRPLLRVAGDAVPPEQLVRDAAARPFDLTRETGARFELVRLADEHH